MRHTMWAAALLACGACTFFDENEYRPVTGPEQSSTGTAFEPSLFPSPPIRAEDPPPPVSGGGLAFDGRRVVVSDPARDTVWIAEVAGDAIELRGSVALEDGDEPGRVLLRGALADVVLRSGGAVARIDLDAQREIVRTPVCEAPRGIDARGAGAVVVCVSGDIVFLDGELRMEGTQRVEPDLRDVVVQGDVMWVSTFRTGDVLELRGGEVVRHRLPPLSQHVPRVAWRMRPSASGDGVVVLHEQMSDSDFTGLPLAYYGSPMTPPGSRIVQTGLARLQSEGTPVLTVVDEAPLAVDFAELPGGQPLLATAFVPSRESDFRPSLYTARVVEGSVMSSAFFYGQSGDPAAPIDSVAAVGDAVVAFSARDGRLMLWPRPSDRASVVSVGEPVIDTGHDIFHATTPAQVACASCHPEGRDDAYVWTFSGARKRTQSLTGGILASAPYHWSGDHADMSEILYRGFDTRMNGPDVTFGQVHALERWLDRLPALRVAPLDAGAVERGASVYAEHDCAGCHDASADPTSTDLRGVQAPMLSGAGTRAPYFHDGCAATLAEAMAPDSGCAPDHPSVPGEQAGDVVAYLEQL